MEEILLEILDRLRAGETLDAKALQRLIRAHNEGIPDNRDHYAKKQLMPFYLRTKAENPARWTSWNIDKDLERKLTATLQLKPRRTASGVATITVLTKPWPCGGSCLYCPNDVRMPKSYLADEPACQRAERNWFDPYLQVATRLNTLRQMGHTTDKVELIVLGGTWSDYPQDYQVWFATELFRALNEEGTADAGRSMAERRAFYDACGIPSERPDCAAFAKDAQQAVNAGMLTYNQAVARLYGCAASAESATLRPHASDHANSGPTTDEDLRTPPASPVVPHANVRPNRTSVQAAAATEPEHAATPWQQAAIIQHATFEQLEAQQASNETAAHRVVGLVVETRPDAISAESLSLIRRLGCTKVQIGIQSLDARILALNSRSGTSVDRIADAFALLRLFGFKIHAHFMANLLGASPEEDKRDYQRLVRDEAFLPDEVKLYPCALVGGTGLCAHHDDGTWRPYTEDELLDVLAADVEATPPFVRISRMIRDISSHDILVGNKKVNLRQLVDGKVAAEGRAVQEIRSREISTNPPALEDLALHDFAYETAVSTEHFLQWTAPDGRIAGFLRLSLPHAGSVVWLQRQLADLDSLPFAPDTAMIREVHVYGAVAGIHQEGNAAQHHGLGKKLVEKACALARTEGYARLNVISAIGTREYYRRLGFADAGLYQQRPLVQRRA